MTGSPIETKPTFNPMIGPSPYLQIYMGARYDPCMKNIPNVQNATVPVYWPCPNATSLRAECSLSQSCGFSGVPNPRVGGSLNDKPEPNQWFRFITPMFIHAGFVHIGFNLLVQMTMGAEMERMIGIWRYSLTYLASGIFGFVFGGNYAAQLEPSDGCSGALFGILALYLLDLLYDWPQRQSPWLELIIMILGVAVSFVLGLLPGLDNFAHIGGFIMGLAIGLTIMRSPNALRERIGLARQPYVAMSGGAGQATPENRKTSSFKDFFRAKTLSPSGEDNDSKGPLDFFRGRKPLWWAWWLVRAGALVAVLIGFIMLIVNFYRYPTSNCSWCYRLSCLVSDLPLDVGMSANANTAGQWVVRAEHTAQYQARLDSLFWNMPGNSSISKYTHIACYLRIYQHTIGATLRIIIPVSTDIMLQAKPTLFRIINYHIHE